MPIADPGHAATTPQPSQPSQMESGGVASRLLEEPPPAPDKRLFSKTEPAVTIPRTGTGARESKQLDKRSLDYILRSGLAGGLAGCAVRGARILTRRSCVDL